MNMKQEIVIYWCRRDFRLHDNPALSEAIEYARSHQLSLMPLYILDSYLLDSQETIGFPRKQLLASILCSFAKMFPTFFIVQGTPITIMNELLCNYNVHVFWNSDVEPYARERDNNVYELISNSGGTVHSFRDQLTVSPQLRSGTGTIYSVFTPFRNASLQEFVGSRTYSKVDWSDITFLDSHVHFATRLPIEANALFNSIDSPWEVTYYDKEQTHTINLDTLFDRKLMNHAWYVTEEEALSAMEDFVETKLPHYKTNRDSLELDTIHGGQTSKMSVALKWGLISSRYITQYIINKHRDWQSDPNIFHYISELMWREFYRYILYHCPEVLNHEFQPKFRTNTTIKMVTDNPSSICGSHSIDWLTNKEASARFLKWIQGETGYLVVDAAMHQLIQTGWMHNRARMIVASILTKNLGIDWRWGQAYFRAMLVDLDEASNNGGWQWASSVGADPKPIRIFNPHTQESKFDPKHLFIQQWLPSEYSIQEPYVQHSYARQEALKRYKLTKDTNVARDY